MCKYGLVVFINTIFSCADFCSIPSVFIRLALFASFSRVPFVLIYPIFTCADFYSVPSVLIQLVLFASFSCANFFWLFHLSDFSPADFCSVRFVLT